VTISRFPDSPTDSASDRARWLRAAGGLKAAIDAGLLREATTLTMVEALLLGLMRQGVTKYLAIFGHGSTALADVIMAYEAEGLVRCWQFRNEIEMAHAGTALSWVYGEVGAVVTSIGPGAFQAMAASLAAASNGVGLYHLYGDETTSGEGYNMQQVPKPAQGIFSQITSLMGSSYTLHTPGALRDGLRKGAACVFHPWRPGPFYINLPLNTQPEHVTLRLDALPDRPVYPALAPADDEGIRNCRNRQGRNKARRRQSHGFRSYQAPRRKGESARGVEPRCLGSHGVRPCAEYVRRRLQGFDQRQLGDGGGRTAGGDRQPRRLPGGLFRHRLAEGTDGGQHQCRSDRCPALQQHDRADG
jgi:3D-(3,5/4)-trihydroxycyclohexane-1,2-dione acylhydrolase (decyclizing)